MFKCCVCNKSTKKEKPNGEVTKLTPKQSQKVTDSQIVAAVIDSTKTEENGLINRDDKLNGDLQRFEKVSPSMENSSTEVIDDLTVKSPLPSGKRDEVNDNSRSKKESIAKSNGNEVDNGIENALDRTKEGKEVEANGTEDLNENEGVNEGDNISANDDVDSGGGLMKVILNPGLPGTIKTNLYNSPAYIERTIDDGPEDEGDDSVFEACPNDASSDKKMPTGIFLLMRCTRSFCL